jgi:hypothetical protein
MLSNERYEYRKKRKDGLIGPYPTDREKELTKLTSELMEAYTHSVLFCNFGSGCLSEEDKTREEIYNIKLERDMVWAPWLGGWICLECYNHFCIEQYHSDTKERDRDEEKRLLEFLRRHNTL